MSSAMEAVAFEAEVEGGMIRVPAAYRSRFTRPVRVILLAEESEPARSEPMRGDMISRLLKSPRKIKDFKPLSRSDIYE